MTEERPKMTLHAWFVSYMALEGDAQIAAIGNSMVFIGAAEITGLDTIKEMESIVKLQNKVATPNPLKIISYKREPAADKEYELDPSTYKFEPTGLSRVK